MASQSSPVSTPTRKVSPPEPFKQNTPPPPTPPSFPSTETKPTEVEPITPEQQAYLATAGPLTNIDKFIIFKGTLTEEDKKF